MPSPSDGPKTVVSEVVAGAALFAENQGVHKHKIEELVGVRVSELFGQVPDRMPDELPQRLLRAASRGPGDVGHLALGPIAPATYIAPLEDTARVAGSLMEVIQTTVDYYSLLAGRLEGSVEESNGEIRMLAEHPSDVIDEGRVGEVVLSVFKHRIFNSTGIPNAIKRIDLKYGSKAQRDAYQAHFGVPVRLRQEVCALVFDPKAVEQKPRHANPGAFRYLRASLERMRASQVGKLPFGELERLMSAIEQNANDGEFTAVAAAQRAGMSTRSAQRIMSARGSSLKQTIDNVRRRKALEYLAEDKMSTDEIASQLGYSDGRAFRRAFSRWTGATPSNARRYLR